MLRYCRCLRRGASEPIPLGGKYRKPAPRRFGGVPMIRPIHFDFMYMRPAKPLRAILENRALPPVLYEKADQIVAIDDALVESRVELQVHMTLTQLSKSVRNADDFIRQHMLGTDTRPSLHALWFHPVVGLGSNQHVISLLPTHEIVPLASLLSYDYRHGKMDLAMAEQTFRALSDSTVAHSVVARRELYNQMIRCYALADEPEKALELIREMKACHLRRTFVSYAPLFRLARKKSDVDLHEKVSTVLRECEGGLANKWLYIDVPRVTHIFWVFVRYNWAAISLVLLTLSGCVSSILFMMSGVG